MKVNIFNTDKKYNIIYADPPWHYNQKGSRETAENHYKTMKTTDIQNLPIRSICKPDSIIFMWATFPNILEAIKVMESWGFIYKTAAFVWIKKNKNGSNFWGMGAYTRANAEVCLLGVSKQTKVSDFIKSHRVHQIVESTIEDHSKKPDIVRDKIIDLCGDLPRIELFARQQINGWDCWGDEV